MTCNFRVGQKVVCVSEWKRIGGFGGEIGPIHGEVYTIREVGFLHPDFPRMVTVRLDEIANEVWLGFETCFAATRFRPVVQRKTDISIFKALLTPSKEKVETAS